MCLHTRSFRYVNVNDEIQNKGYHVLHAALSVTSVRTREHLREHAQVRKLTSDAGFIIHKSFGRLKVCLQLI